MKKAFNKDMTIAEVLSANENLKDILMGFGMHCFSCPCALSETLEEAAEVHEIDIELLLNKLNEANK
ncbi:MAG: DUF1858 domain-containing protein [Clostridiales bacterium]|nr:DUF1858 domain-containing protein [Clostridiales bacterium]